jgi:hypothetical protein
MLAQRGWTTGGFPSLLLALCERGRTFAEAKRTAHGFDFLLPSVLFCLPLTRFATEETGFGDTGFVAQGWWRVGGREMIMTQAGVGGVILEVVGNEGVRVVAIIIRCEGIV